MIPDYQALMAPVLRQLNDGQEHAARDMAAALAAEFGLTEEELAHDPNPTVVPWVRDRSPGRPRRNG